MLSEETLKLIEQIKSDMKNNLSEHRFNHCVRVMEKAQELARICNKKNYDEKVSEDEAALAGLTHDIAKEVPDENVFRIAKENDIEFDEIETKNTALLHGKLGAHIIKERYGLNENIQNAVKYHTTTSIEMNLLAKIIYVSDKVEEGRNSDTYDVEYERQLAEEDIDKAMLYILDANITALVKKKKLIHPNSILTRNKIKLDRNL